MNNPALAFKAAEFKTIRARPLLAEAMGLATPRIYAEVPQSAVLPYVVHGQHEIDTEDHGGCGSTSDIVSTVQWWTKDIGELKGSDVARLMGVEIIDGLLHDIDIVGYAVVLTAIEEPEFYSTDPDGSTRGRIVVRTEITSLA